MSTLPDDVHAKPTTGPLLGPLIFEPWLLPKVWGGTRLAHWGKPIPPATPGTRIGESWELADLPSTSASGGGGEPAISRIAHGPAQGQSIHDARQSLGRDLLAPGLLTPEGRFPLLIKLLDAREHLSIQVHPSPAYAAAHPSAKLKTECWHILEAEPIDGKPPVIFKGLKQGVTKRDLEQALRHADGSGLVDLLTACPARVGDCHTLPSGTIHALGAGVLVAEVQTPSDTTFRLYDWTREYARPPRAMHVEQAFECAILESPPPAKRRENQARALVADTEFFSLIEAQGPGPATPAALTPGACVIVFAPTDALELVTPSARTMLPRGTLALIPAAIVADTHIKCTPVARYLLTAPKSPSDRAAFNPAERLPSR
jgi:mannose-6-phosphate isomerase